MSAGALIHGGALLAAERDSAARFAEALALLVRTAPDPATVSTLAPSPAWVGWDHAARKLWPAPDDREGDLTEHPGDRWLDEIGTAARRQLLALDRLAVIGQGDWYSQNLRWIDRRLHVVYDWAHGLTAQVDGSALLTRIAAGHTSISSSDCARSAAEAFLVERAARRIRFAQANHQFGAHHDLIAKLASIMTY